MRGGAPGYEQVGGIAGTSGDIAGGSNRLVTFHGEHVLTGMSVLSLGTGEVRTLEIDPIGAKAGRAQVAMDEGGRIVVRDDAGRFFEVSAKSGKAEQILDAAVPDALVTTARFVETRSEAADAAEAVRELRGGGWKDITAGLPEFTDHDQAEIAGLASVDGVLYATVDNPGGSREDGNVPGLYRFDGTGWSLVTEFSHGYGIGHVVGGGAGRLFVRVPEGIAEVDLATGLWKTVSAASSVHTAGMQGAVFEHGKLHVISSLARTNERGIESASDRVVSVYDPEAGTWTHVPVDHEMDDKPHVELVVDGAGNLWFGSNYSGVFRAKQLEDGSYGAFRQVSERSGKLFTDGGGTVHLSYEITPTTQKSTIFRYDGGAGENAVWTVVHEDRGYGIDGHAVAGLDATFMNGMRFSEFMISGSRKLDLPEMPGGEGRLIASHDGVVFARTTVEGVQKVVALDVAAAADAAVPYDADLKVATALNLVDGDAVKTRAAGLEILADGTIAAGLVVDGAGRLVVTSADGQTRIDLEDLPGAIADMDARPDGTGLVIATDAGAFIYEDGDVREVAAGAVARIDVAEDGTLALLQGKTVTVRDAAGDTVFRETFGFSYVEDIAVDSGAGMVYVAGFSNQTLPSGLPVQGPHLRAYDLASGALVWSRFEFPGSEKSSNIADARLYHVEIGADGALYVLGESAGTQTIFRYDGTEAGTFTDPREMTTKIDHHNDLWNTASAHVAYHARIDKLDGTVEASQMTMSRLGSSGKSNTYKVGDIAADEQGRVYIGGENAAFLNNRDGISINGVDVPDYDGSDPSFMALSPDLTSRLSWHSLDMGGASGRVEQVATRDGKTVLLTAYEDGELFVTGGPANGGGANLHLSVIETGAIYAADGDTPERGTRRDDAIAGDAGRGLILGRAGDDVLDGGSGNDRLVGGRGKDTLDGGHGRDRLFGNSGSDALSAGTDGDRIEGGNGADTLTGGAGDDVLSGGRGDDVFRFAPGDGQDIVRDFDPEADTLEFDVPGRMAPVASQDGADVLLAYGTGDAVRLLGVTVDQLSGGENLFF